MISKLRNFFPLIRTRESILYEIQTTPKLLSIFQTWNFEQQNEFLDFCSGAKGVKLLYDGFFKEILNPEYTPERVNDFLSTLLNKKVSIIAVLPADSTRIADESSLLIMDIVVQLEDNTIANIEVQKIGYMFPGERSACYSADLLLRQYKRIRDKQKKKFSYQDIKTVYTIVLFEKSPHEFHEFPNTYIHKFQQISDTGLELELLQKYVFIPLDIFLKSKQTIDNKLDGWLSLFASDDPHKIVELITKYPEFKSIYEKVYEMCMNMEDIMALFSKELQELDRNTVQYMIDEQQEVINEQKKCIEENERILAEQATSLAEKDKFLAEKDKFLAEKDKFLAEKDKSLAEKDKEIERLKQLLEQKEKS